MNISYDHFPAAISCISREYLVLKMHFQDKDASEADNTNEHFSISASRRGADIALFLDPATVRYMAAQLEEAVRCMEEAMLVENGFITEKEDES